MRLYDEHSVRARNVEAIEADLHTFSLLRTDPSNDQSAGFCGAFLIAATLMHGRFTIAELRDAVLHDPRIETLMMKIRHVPAGEPETIKVLLTGGKSETTDVRSVSRLSAREDICAKFRDCAGTLLAQPAIERLEEMVLALEQQPDLSELMRAAAVT